MVRTASDPRGHRFPAIRDAGNRAVDRDSRAKPNEAESPNRDSARRSGFVDSGFRDSLSVDARRNEPDFQFSVGSKRKRFPCFADAAKLADSPWPTRRPSMEKACEVRFWKLSHAVPYKKVFF